MDNATELNLRLGRGINMGNSFEAPDEDAWSNPWNPEYFKLMAELGFNHVRVPIRWDTPERCLQEPPYTINPDFLERIKFVVDEALKNKLHIIINMHHHNALYEDPPNQKEKFLSQWQQIAPYFRNYSDSLLFEVLNEPHNNLTPDLWNEFLHEALATIRSSNPDRVILLGTAEWGGLRSLPKLVIPDDPNLILTIHYYNPFEFTHQGAQWVNGADKWLGTRWTNTEAEREKVIQEFSYALELQKGRNIPIHIGEFGAYSTADSTSRELWTNFVARWFEEQGFSWAYWEFSAGYGIFDKQTGTFRQGLKEALLERPMPLTSE